MQDINRRKFLRLGACGAMGYTTLVSSLVSLKAMSAAAVANSSVNDSYKALVCISMNGGNDSFNMLVPRGTSEYNEYASVRSNLALAQSELLPITHATPDGKLYGIHPAMPRLQNLFAQNKAAFIANVGTLVEPFTSAADYNTGTKEEPLGLFSHADQMAHWQTAIPQERGGVGWGGRMADLLQGMNNNTNLSMNISLAGTNLFQSGQEVFPYAISNDGTGSIGITNYEGTDPFEILKRTAIDSIMNHHYQDVFRNAYAETVRGAQVNHGIFSTAIGDLPPLNTSFSNTDLSQSLNMVARTMAIREELDVQRQCFFVEFGTFDHHDELLNNQSNLLSIMDNAIAEFQTALQELGLEDCVTTFTISDFARTLTSNGNGTDHAWGGNALVVGGQVNGGDLYGTYPDLGLGSALDLGNGIQVPTTATDEYFAELALWFGVSPNDLPIVLPNIANFYSIGGGNPLGFLQL